MGRMATGLENPNFYTIAEILCYGPRARGFGKMCPRDGRLGCSFVDALPSKDAQRATHYLSWCWQYSLDDFTSSISIWLQRCEQDAFAVHIWVCCLCNNQFRIMEEQGRSGVDELGTIFEDRLRQIGDVLVMLDH